ncbi:MAG TPA: hypothetical protein DEA90_00110 [Opitutae bacterium]|nr:hypothetical protein [Puniceicoccaceae bacterium]HBR92551.1 hypothetical protein [Opitutae bacterium]|tara:strand:+ start:12807 stop:14576 length:1770 start_codon:yes stop_codon:yes gene_type:complete
MDIAIVTGAETPLGLSLIQRLVHQGYRVHGIGNNFSKVTFADPQFFAHPVDLSNLTAVSETMAQILEKEKSLDLLIHAIDVTPGAAFEKLPVGNLEAILKIGLLGPVMLTRLALPNLLRFRGQLINVIPANKSGAPASAVNALLEGGLREMNRALFDRARDVGLRVTNLVLRQNPEPDALSVKSSEQTHIDLEDVARAVEQLLDPNFANVPAELVLYPRTSAHADQVLPEVSLPLDPYSEIVLPPQAYCPPDQPKIPTQEKERVERTIPYTDEEMEEKIAAAIEDFEAHPERYEPSQKQDSKGKARPDRKQKQKGERAPREDAAQQSSPEQQVEAESNSEQSHDSQDSGNSKRRRGRRRGGRNRNRDRDGKESSEPSNHAEPSHGEGAQSQSEQKDVPAASSNSVESDPSADKPKRSSRRGRSRVEPKPILDARIETESEFLSKPDPRPQRRGRTRATAKSKVSSAESVVPAPIPAPVSVTEVAPLPRLESEAPQSVASEKKAASHFSEPKQEAQAAQASEAESSAAPKASAKKAPAKKATKKATKKAAKKAVKKKVAKKAAKKKSAKKATKKAAKKKVAKKVEVKEAE